MIFKVFTACAFSLAMVFAADQAAAQAPASDAGWRTVAPENLLVLDTAKGRILVELEPRMAPLAVGRIRTLADQGFYDGLKFHRVMEGFMAQGGDPLGTGAGGSELPDLPGEFTFRRGRDAGFTGVVIGTTGQQGLLGSVPIITQPDAQMMVTSDFKVPAYGLFCPGVAGMARTGDNPDSANSQFFLMMAENESLNASYTPFGRVVAGLDVVKALKKGAAAENGRVTDPDVIVSARTAAGLPEGRRPSVRIMATSTPAFAALVEQMRTERGTRFNICDVQPPVEVLGG